MKHIQTFLVVLAILGLSRSSAFAQLEWAGDKYLDDGQIITENIILTGNTNIYVNSGTAIISGIISGTESLAKFGVGKLILTGANTYTGKTTISDGATIVLKYPGKIENSSEVILGDNAKFDVREAGYFPKIKALNSIYSNSEVILQHSSDLYLGNGGEADGGGSFAGRFITESPIGGIVKTGSATFTMSNSDHIVTNSFHQFAGTVILNGCRIGRYMSQNNNNILTVIGDVTFENFFDVYQGGAINMDLTTATPSKLTIGKSIYIPSKLTFNVKTTMPQENYVLIEAGSGIKSLDQFMLNPVTNFPDAELSIESPHKLLFNSGALKVAETKLAEISVYPNPTIGELRIEAGELRIDNVEIVDIMGKNMML